MTEARSEDAAIVADGCRIASSHPSLAGHFPGNPVVPGVVLLDEVLALILRHHPERVLSGIPTVKFLSPLLPEEPFSIRLDRKGQDFHFECSAADRALARGSLRTTDAEGG